MQGLAGQRRSLASNALAGWHGSHAATQPLPPQPNAQDQVGRFVFCHNSVPTDVYVSLPRKMQC